MFTTTFTGFRIQALVATVSNFLLCPYLTHQIYLCMCQVDGWHKLYANRAFAFYVQVIIWTSFVYSIYVKCPLGKQFIFYFKAVIYIQIKVRANHTSHIWIIYIITSQIRTFTKHQVSLEYSFVFKYGSLHIMEGNTPEIIFR